MMIKCNCDKLYPDVRPGSHWVNCNVSIFMRATAAATMEETLKELGCVNISNDDGSVFANYKGHEINIKREGNHWLLGIIGPVVRGMLEKKNFDSLLERLITMDLDGEF